MLSYINRVEVELHSQCNRKCNWCPNKDIDRTNYIEMPEETYFKIIDELKEKNFENKINTGSKFIYFSRFNEPFINVDLLKKRIIQAREKIKAIYACNTNGDFITKESLEGLFLDRLNIMDYDNAGMGACKEKLIKAGCIIIRARESEPVIIASHRNIGKITYRVNWSKHVLLEDRAGLLTKDIYDTDNEKIEWYLNKDKRKVPCFEPKESLYIHYNGDVVPCCHIRHDAEKHKKYVFGNVNESSIEEIYYSKQMTNFRSATIQFREAPEPCIYCQKEKRTTIYKE